LLLSQKYKQLTNQLQFDYDSPLTQLLLSQKYKQLTNQLQFDYNLPLTMNHRDSDVGCIYGESLRE